MANKKESSEIVFLEPIKPIKEIDVRDIGFPIALGKTKDGGAAPIFFDRESKSWKPAPNLTVGAVLDAERFFGDWVYMPIKTSWGIFPTPVEIYGGGVSILGIKSQFKTRRSTEITGLEFSGGETGKRPGFTLI